MRRPFHELDDLTLYTEEARRLEQKRLEQRLTDHWKAVAELELKEALKKLFR